MKKDSSLDVRTLCFIVHDHELMLKICMHTVKEKIFVGEKFHTFSSKTFRMELNFVLSN